MDIQTELSTVAFDANKAELAMLSHSEVPEGIRLETGSALKVETDAG